ncbi:MAG: Ig-like domain-containing protein, partial [Plesiomonas shigelloides]
MTTTLTTPILLSDQPVEIMTGRTLTLSIGSDVSSVRVLEGPEHGNVTANPDGTFAVVMSDTDYTGPASFRYQVSYADGRVETAQAELNLVPGKQAAGWGMGDFMLLETDAEDRTVIEHGDNHRTVHVSGSEDALSLADIAAREGLKKEQITVDWLKEHPEYGASPDMALDEEAGLLLWYAISGQHAPANSNWLLFEKGFEYSAFNVIGTQGESPLHPVLISSYGESGEVVLNGNIKGWNGTANIVIQDINAVGDVTFLEGNNILFEDFNTSHTEINFQNLNAVTLRNSKSLDSYRETSANPNDGIWNAHQDRASGIYVSGTDGLLLENNTFDHAGWGEGYDYNMSEDAPQAPSMYSHNVYIQNDNTDVTFRDNITMRAASFGAQVRSGGFIEDNVFLDNNVAVNFLGGDYKGAGFI